MTELEAIKNCILQLPPNELQSSRAWFHEFEKELWGQKENITDGLVSESVPPSELAGKMRILCDEKTLMEPVVPNEDWDSLR